MHEIKFTVGKSKEMVFTARKGEIVRGNSTLWGKFPQEMYRKKVKKHTALV